MEITKTSILDDEQEEDFPFNTIDEHDIFFTQLLRLHLMPNGITLAVSLIAEREAEHNGFAGKMDQSLQLDSN